MTTLSPQTPYVGPVSLQDGTLIHIHGVAEHHHSQFIISLQSGPSINPRSDAPFVFNPRFDENKVVRNSQSGNSWGYEEKYGGFPFHKGKKFHVQILVQHDKYKVSVDEHDFTEFMHRTSMSAVTHLIVEGGIRIHEVQVIGPVLVYPGPKGAYPPPSRTFLAIPAYNPPVPFVQNIPGGIYPGKMIFISGIPHPSPSRFSIYLQNGMSHDPNQIGVVVDARFNFRGESNTLVRNYRDDNWGSEERGVSYFPFMPNVPFEIIIFVEDHQYKVAVNNKHLLEFNHQLPLNRVDTLRIDGDVRLTQVRFQ